jgi:hypothetical protein
MKTEYKNAFLQHSKIKLLDMFVRVTTTDILTLNFSGLYHSQFEGGTLLIM